jgi:archaemetzincin
VIELAPVGQEVPLASLDLLAAGLARVFQASCHVREQFIDPAEAFNPVRKQYHATALLRTLSAQATGNRLLGIAQVDLFVPIFTYVFGEAQISGRCAIVSTHRLREEYYGLPANEDLSQRRLLTEAIHEIGHTYGLRHCHDWQCAMASSNAIDRLDLKQPTLCPDCRAAAGL